MYDGPYGDSRHTTLRDYKQVFEGDECANSITHGFYKKERS